MPQVAADAPGGGATGRSATPNDGVGATYPLGVVGGELAGADDLGAVVLPASGSVAADRWSPSQSGTGTLDASQSPPSSSHGSESHVGSEPKPCSSSVEAVTDCCVDAKTGAADSGAGCSLAGRGAAGSRESGCAVGVSDAPDVLRVLDCVAEPHPGWLGGGVPEGDCAVGAEGGSAALRVPDCVAELLPGWVGAGALEEEGAVCCCGADSAGPVVTAGSGRRSTFGPEPPAGAESPSVTTNSMFTLSTFWMLCPRIARFSARPVNAFKAPVWAKLTVSVRPSNPVTEAFGATIIQTNRLLLFSSSMMSGHARRNISTEPAPPDCAAGARLRSGCAAWG